MAEDTYWEDKVAYDTAHHRYQVLCEVDPVQARLFSDDFYYGTPDGPGTGGEWSEVALELERALAGRANT